MLTHQSVSFDFFAGVNPHLAHIFSCSNISSCTCFRKLSASSNISASIGRLEECRIPFTYGRGMKRLQTSGLEPKSGSSLKFNAFFLGPSHTSGKSFLQIRPLGPTLYTILLSEKNNKQKQTDKQTRC